ncbi:relaxase/mobilization nuclease domain-containing protein [Komagataeibacter medellinensis]|uniref:relaxase/mobilization nuclease domain-containing protein n=1 Tax=Komagataeibacter medellinensis TaxID=1177712 RepID=UPI0012949301|nr:hypothetical protein [Komagataeibacter medellinensis]
MAGYQFAHLEMYSRKVLVKPSDKKNKKKIWNTTDIFAEAKREAGACGHVENPSPPVVVFGQSLEDTEAEHDRRCDAAVSTMKNGKTRKLRSTQNTLMTVVLSHPDETYTSDVKRWEKLSIAWLKARYGDQLKTVIRHDDEKHEHLHAYIIPDDLDAASMHPGNAEKQRSERAGQAKGDANRAYKQGLREWQDSYHRDVGIRCGLARTGPGLERMSRPAWVARQKSYDHYADMLNNAARYEKKLKRKVAKEWAKTSIVGKMSFARSSATNADVDERVSKRVSASNKKYEKQFENAEKSRNKAISERDDAIVRASETEAKNSHLESRNSELEGQITTANDALSRIDAALAENVMNLHEKASETGLETDYQMLSGACLAVADISKVQRLELAMLQVSSVVKDVSRRVPDMFKKAFGWAIEKVAQRRSMAVPGPNRP